MTTKLEGPSQILYSEQVDNLLLWIEAAPDKFVSLILNLKQLNFASLFFVEKKKNELLNKVLRNSNLNQTNLLWTILQPVCHRDFYYSSKMEFLREQTETFDGKTVSFGFILK